MYYRRKVLLSILQFFGGQLEAVDLQKLLFLFTRHQANPAYDFVPYKYGGFSFQAEEDCQVLLSKGFLEKKGKTWMLINQTEYIESLNDADKNLLLDLGLKYGKFRGDALIHKVYTEYPYYAIKSKIAPKILSKTELKKTLELQPNTDTQAIFTLGYEGESLDYFLEQCVKNGIQHLCDVRKNAFSMKRGFSKKKLQNYLNQVGVSYSHHPDLGIASEKRKDTKKTQNWQQLFDEYENNVATEKAELANLLKLLKQHKRVALMCFEKHHSDCHRSRLLNVLNQNLPDGCEVLHL